MLLTWKKASISHTIPGTFSWIHHSRGGDCHGAFLPHRECVCYERCPRCSVEFELDVNFDRVNPTRSKDEVLAPLTITSKDLVRTDRSPKNGDLFIALHCIVLYCNGFDSIGQDCCLSLDSHTSNN